MPEGDTIFRAAFRLRKVLVGAKVREASGTAHGPFPTIDAERLRDATIDAVEARGKHLLMHFDHELIVHSHMGMKGSWHIYAEGETWQRPVEKAGLVLSTGEVTAACFFPKVLELLTAADLRRHPYLRRLGPDLLGGVLDEDAIVARFRTHKTTPIGQAILNQTIVCGVGNVYKSELLFLLRLDPFAPVAALGDEQLVALLRKARDLLKKNLGGADRRRTRFGRDGKRLWVYGRSGAPCFHCGSRIQLRRQGDLGRTTYWCPECQATELFGKSGPASPGDPPRKPD